MRPGTGSVAPKADRKITFAGSQLFYRETIADRRAGAWRPVALEPLNPKGHARLLPEADFVALTCPLTRKTENLVDAAGLARMKPSAYLVTVARGPVVDEGALIAALSARRIAGAGIDVTMEEPLSPTSPLWDMEQVLITPHTAGETRRYEDNVIEVLLDNLERLWRGEEPLRNQVV
jgi:phosphoglycerate dehydrogenase-like enzyme